MIDIYNKIFKNIKTNPLIFIVSGLVFVLCLILGCILGLNDTTSGLFSDNVCNYYLTILTPQTSIFGFFIKRILNIILFFIPIYLLSLNKYTFFINFIFVGYRGLILGISFKVILTVLSFNGFVIWLFLIFIQNLLLTFSIIVFISNVFLDVYCKFTYKKLNVYLLISLIVAVVGAILELILLICVFRPLNFYF